MIRSRPAVLLRRPRGLARRSERPFQRSLGRCTRSPCVDLERAVGDDSDRRAGHLDGHRFGRPVAVGSRIQARLGYLYPPKEALAEQDTPPYTWAQRLTHDLGNARLLTYSGDGHGAVTDLNPCVVGHMLAYLEAGVLPPTGASCDQVL